MPELPEVETIARELAKKIIGLRITDVWADWAKSVKQAGGIKNLKKHIKNKKILMVSRRAKFIIIDIEGPKTIFIHQKISGHLLYGKWQLIDNSWESVLRGPLKDDPRNKYLRIVFSFNNGYQMALSDLRRFGKVILTDDRKMKVLKEVRDLGPEPLEVKLADFKKLFKNKKGQLKQVLMDPFFIAGIGNIYSDEILWDAGFHPLKRVESLKDGDLKGLSVSIRKILLRAIRYKGDSMDDYRLPSGAKGGYQNIQKAYHQTGKKCSKRDGGMIIRIKVGGRSAHFCSKHQQL